MAEGVAAAGRTRTTVLLLIVQVVCAVGIVASYAALQLDVVTPHGAPYLVTNLVSAAGLVAVAVIDLQPGFVITNTLWVVVSAAGLVRHRRGRAEPTA